MSVKNSFTPCTITFYLFIFKNWWTSRLRKQQCGCSSEHLHIVKRNTPIFKRKSQHGTSSGNGILLERPPKPPITQRCTARRLYKSSVWHREMRRSAPVTRERMRLMRCRVCGPAQAHPLWLMQTCPCVSSHFLYTEEEAPSGQAGIIKPL